MEDIEKDMVDLLKQEMATGTYFVDHEKRPDETGYGGSESWKAISAVDDVTLMKMYKSEWCEDYVPTGKRNDYDLYIMDNKVFGATITSEQPEDSTVKDAKLPQNVRAVFDLLRQYPKVDKDRLFARLELTARVKMRTK